MLAYLFWFAGIVHVRAATAGVFTALMPASALFLSTLVPGEPLTAAKIVNCVLVLGSICLLSLPGHPPAVGQQQTARGGP